MQKFTNSKFNSPDNQLGKNGKTTKRLKESLENFEQKLDNDFLIEYLEKVVVGKIFKSHNHAISRNDALHSFKRTLEMDEVMLSNCVLFLVIDVIAELHLRENVAKYDALNTGVTPTHKDKLLDLYMIVYLSAFQSNLNEGRINIINNLFLKENLSEDEIGEIHAKISGIES